MIKNLLIVIVLGCVISTIYISIKLNNQLKEAFKESENKILISSYRCDSLVHANDSLISVIQENQIEIGRYEYMIDLLRQNLDSNKVDKIIKNIE